jgi:hypothetical protein
VATQEWKSLKKGIFYRYITPEMESRQEEVASSHEDIIAEIQCRTFHLIFYSRFPEEILGNIYSFVW